MNGTPLRLFPDELRTTAGSLGRLSDDTSQMQSELSRAWARLDAGWDGYAEEDIHGYFNEAMGKVSEMVAVLAQIGQVLISTADSIEAADQIAMGLFNDLIAGGAQVGNRRPPGLAKMASPQPEGPRQSDPMSDLEKTIWEMIGYQCPMDPTPLLEAIHNATPEERQAILRDPELLRLFYLGLGPLAPTYIAALFEGAEWPPLQTVKPHNQYDHQADLGVMGCGIVSGAAAAEFFDEDAYDAVYRDLVAVMSGYGFTKEGGIQPHQLAGLLGSVLEQHGMSVNEFNFGTSTIGAFDYSQEVGAPQALEQLRESLLNGNQVIVDFVADDVGAGTTVGCSSYGQQGCDGYFSHFARVVGFSEDGKTVYVAETLAPGEFDPSLPDVPGQRDAVVGIPIDDFMASWYNPEKRVSQSPGVTAETVGYWMLEISPGPADIP